MEKEKIDRINYLARKAKTENLSAAEREEQKALRDAYLAEFRASFTGMLDNTYIQYPDGQKKKLERRSASGAAIKKEKSCGAVIFRTRNGVHETLLLHHNAGHWAFAKGHVEQDEKEHETALREIREETGLHVSLEPDFRRITTFSPKPGVIKDVVYFIAWWKEGEAVPQLNEISELCWLPLDEAITCVTHESDRTVLREAISYLQEKGQL